MLQTVCPKGPVTRGIDIYHGNYVEDFKQVAAHGIEYVWLKAWEYHIDDTFKTRWATLKTDGIIRGAYDFFHPAKDPISQANSFLNVVGHLDAGDLPCALDWEVTDGVGIADDQKAALKWLEYVERATKKTPIIYMSSSFMPLDQRFDRFGLWVANYGVTCPHVPNRRQSWDFWQSSESGRVPGMRGMSDTDVFNGDLAALKAFIAKSNIA